MFPTDLVNLIGFYAYGVGKYCLEDELAYICCNRGMIPLSFLEPTLVIKGHAIYFNPDIPFSVDRVTNPLREDAPFFPWALIDPESFVFSNTLMYWASQIKPKTFTALKTYRKTIKKHLTRCFFSHKWFEGLGNGFVSRFLSNQALQKVESYDFGECKAMFDFICFELKYCGFVSPPVVLHPVVHDSASLSRVSFALV